MLAPRHLPLLASFVQVCRDGSFTKAARSLSLSKSVVSAHVRALEEVLGARLIQRTTRSLSLTQTGQDVLAAADHMLTAANEVVRVAERKQDAPTGVLRVAAPVDLGALLVAPAVARLRSRFSGLRAELLLNDEMMDPIVHQLDAMLSVNVPKDPSLVSTPLGEDVEIVVASPGLAQEWRAARQPRDLAAAPWVAHPAIPPQVRHQFWNKRGAVQRMAPSEAGILANTSDAIRSLVVGGAGFAVLPSLMVSEDLRARRMVRVLPAWRRRSIVLHARLPSQSHPPARVTFFLEELRAVFQLTGFEDQYAAIALRHPLRYPPK
jgi:DNA-binding transcriptional LysR family regulator